MLYFTVQRSQTLQSLFCPFMLSIQLVLLTGWGVFFCLSYSLLHNVGSWKWLYITGGKAQLMTAALFTSGNLHLSVTVLPGIVLNPWRFFFPSVEVHCIDVCNEDKVHFQFLDLNSLLLLLSPLWHIVNVSHRAQQHTKNWHGSKQRLVCLFPSNVVQLSHLHFCGWSMQSYSSASCFLRHYCAVACRVLASAVQFYLCCCVKLTYLLCWLGWYDGRHIKNNNNNKTLIIS